MSGFVKLVVFVPVPHADVVRKVMAGAGAGKQGDYDSCSFSSRGMGRFRPLRGSHPAIGTEGVLQEVEEERIEVLCLRKNVKTVIDAVRKAHPYEEPAIDVIPLENI